MLVLRAINKTLKEEFTTDKQISSNNYRQAKIIISQIIKFYNEERPHRSLEMYTPNIAYEMNRILKRKWKAYHKNYATKSYEDMLSLMN